MGDAFGNLQDKFEVVTENITDCQILSNLINKNKSSSLLGCVTEESQIADNTKNYIKIINDKGKYNIELIEIGEDHYDDYDLLIPNTKFIYEQYSDPFYYNDVKYDSTSNFKTFMDLQSLFAQFLLIKEKKTKNKGIVLNLGSNSYPAHSEYGYISIMGPCTIFSIIVCLQFSMSTYFFNMRMVDEKEKKLTILLERQGISKKQYFFLDD